MLRKVPFTYTGGKRHVTCDRLDRRPEGRVFKRLPRDPANDGTNMCDRYSCILPDSSCTVTVFCTLNFVVQNGVGLRNRTSKTSLPLTTSTSKKHIQMLIPGHIVLSYKSCKQSLARLEDFQVKTCSNSTGMTMSSNSSMHSYLSKNKGSNIIFYALLGPEVC